MALVLGMSLFVAPIRPVGAGIILSAELDVYFANYAAEARLCEGGVGGFVCSNVSADTDATYGLALGDVNGDGDLDAAFANYLDQNRVCLGDGSGGFTCTDVSDDARGDLWGGLGTHRWRRPSRCGVRQ